MPPRLRLRLLLSAEVGDEPLQVRRRSRAGFQGQPHAWHREERTQKDPLVDDRFGRDDLVDAPRASDEAEHAVVDHPGTQRGRVDVEQTARDRRPDSQPGQARRLWRHSAGDLVSPDRPRQRREHLRDAIDLHQLPGIGPLHRFEQAAAADDREIGGVLAGQAKLEEVRTQHHLADAVVGLRLVAFEPRQQHRRLSGPASLQSIRKRLVMDAAGLVPFRHELTGATVHRRDAGAENLVFLIQHVQPIAMSRVADRQDLARLDA